MKTLLVCLAVAGLPMFAQRVTNPHNSRDFQYALDIAQPGDTIVLDAGVTYAGNFRLRNHGGSTPVIIRTSAIGSLPAAGTRVTPAQASLMPKIVGLEGNPALSINSAHNYKIVGIEIRPAAGTYSWVLVDIGPFDASSASQLSSNIEFDRVYIHGDPVTGAKRAFAMNGRSISVVNSWISDIKSTTNETQTILTWNSPGPLTIVNNYLEASGENIMLGGAVPRILGVVPCDVEIRGNHIFKPLSWNPKHSTFAGKQWIVKNLLEFKNACRVRVERNVLENNWLESQGGFAVVLTPRTQSGRVPWAGVQDVTFDSNVIRNCPAGFTILGKDGNYGGKLRRLRITNNFLDRVGEIRLFGIYAGAESVTIEHNTSLAQRPHIIFADGQPAMNNFVFRNNMFFHGSYGIVGTGTPTGTGTLSHYFPGAVVARNVLIGGKAANYPTNNFFPATVNEVGFGDPLLPDYSLSSRSIYSNAGTDGEDIGADIIALKAMEALTKSGVSAAPASSNLPEPQTGLTFSVQANVGQTGTGAVTLTPVATTYAAGSVVGLSAKAAAGYCFSSWSGLPAGTGNETSLVVQQNYNVTANFIPGFVVPQTTNVGILASGTTFLMNTSASPGCVWTIKTNVDWIRPSKELATSASPTFTYTVQPNTTGTKRTGIITVGDTVVTVTQFP